jgi:copper resistance protein B
MNNANLAALLFIVLTTSFTSFVTHAGGNDDPFLSKIMLDQLETGLGNNDPINFGTQAWFGHDMHKLWLKTEGEYQDSDATDVEIQALYSRPIAPYWDLQLGIRTDIEPSPTRNWAVVGIQGLAPYFFEVDAALFIAEEGHTALRLSAEYELLITQKLILSPEVEMNLYGKDDKALGIGSGLADVSAGLRLRYEIVREFAPYIGVDWSQKFGNTADFARAEEEDTQETQFVVGLRAWF